MSDNGVAPVDSGIPVAVAVGMAQAIVKAARPQDRSRLWSALETGLDAGREAAQEAGLDECWPWQSPADVAFLPARSVTRAIYEALSAIEEPSERIRLVRVAGKAYDSLEPSTGKPVKAGKYGWKTCSLPGCGRKFAARSHEHAYCCPAHRSYSYRARKATAESPAA